MNHRLIHQFFDRSGEPARSPAPGAACPSDEAFANYLGALLPAQERAVLETHALACFPCHELLRMVVDMASAGLTAPLPAHPLSAREGTRSPSPEPLSLRIVGKLAARGIELLNHLELTFRTLVDGPLTPALGTLRRAATPAPAVSEWLCIRGPGQGLDELELQVQADGTVRLVVRCDKLPDLAAGESASIILDVDGAARERRAFDGQPVSFAPLGRGSYRVRVVARAAGAPARALAEAAIDFTG
jgi:hypothetical protein